MSLRRIRYDESMDGLWDELVYTRARLEAEARASDLASAVRDALSRVGETRQNQLQHWETEIVAQAMVDGVDYDLDGIVGDIGINLERLSCKDRKHPRWTRYFGTDAPSSVRRLGLASEVRRVRGWASSLKSEPEAELKELGRRLQDTLARADEALALRERAAAARADHRAREIMTLVDDINALRLSVYGELISRVGRIGQDPSWPDQFFRHGVTYPRRAQTPADNTATE